jgi:hypothetical protein
MVGFMKKLSGFFPLQEKFETDYTLGLRFGSKTDTGYYQIFLTTHPIHINTPHT